MISISVGKRHGTVIVHSQVTAPSIERAIDVAGEGAKVVFPIDGREFFVSAKGNVSATRLTRGHKRGLTMTRRRGESALGFVEKGAC